MQPKHALDSGAGLEYASLHDWQGEVGMLKFFVHLGFWALRPVFVCVLMSLLPAGAWGAEPPVVVVYDLEARGVESYVASSFTDLLCVELSHIKGI